MDETAVCLFQGGRAGNIFLSRGHTVSEKASTAVRRAYMTHVAFICDDAEVQKVLPQILICNRHGVSAADFAAAKAELPGNVHLWRCNSAWVNKELCKDIMRVLATALAPFMDRMHVILMFDAYASHISLQMWNALARWNIHGQLIPASETWLLQPLDVYVFKRFKANMQRHYQLRQIKAVGPAINFRRVVGSTCDAIRDVLCSQGWARAFDSSGFSVRQGKVSERVRGALGLTSLVAVGCSRPTVDELRVCHPRRRKVHAAAIWRRTEDAVALPSTSKASLTSSASKSFVAAGPISSRTRGKAKSSASTV